MKVSRNSLPKHPAHLARLIIASAVIMTTAQAHATDGYFDYGYGIKAKGIGGVGVALPQDSLAPATNPAGLAFVDDRLDLGLSYFNPDRSASVGGSTFSGNGTQDFFIPEIAFKHSLSPSIDVGLAIYGNGGLNSDYKQKIFPGALSNTGVDLTQLFITPTLSYKLNPQHALGISPVISYQRIKVTGLEGFGITDGGYDNSFGGGFRVGYTGQLADWLTAGLTYQSRIWSQKFSKYSGLFAEQGGFDIPSNYALGIAIHPNKSLDLALDVERILFSEVNSVGNQLTPATFASGLGANQGPGFGWNDATVIKTGIAYRPTDNLTLRVGYNYSTQPIPANQTFFNILAPAVVQHHASAGLTWNFQKNLELSAYYAHAFLNSVDGSGNIIGPNANLSMKQNAFGLGLGWKF